MKYLVAGPSHTARWWQRIQWKQFPKPHSMVHLYFEPGGAIFSKKMYQYIKNHIESVDIVYLLVPDFRFGNGILKKYETIPNLFMDGFTHPSKELISQKNDEIMFQYALKVLDQYIVEFDEKIRFVFWCLNYREAENKKKNKYLNAEGIYSHPVWNSELLYKRYSQNMIDISFLQSRIEEFTLDEQGHPSLKGYAFLHYLFKSTSSQEALSVIDSRYNDIVSLLFYESEDDFLSMLLKLKEKQEDIENELYYYNKGMEAFNAKQYNAAIDYYNKALAFNETNYKIYFYLGLCYNFSTLYFLAEKMFKIALELNQEDAALYTQLAVVYRKLGDIDSSLKHLSKALLIDPKYSGAQNEYNRVLALKKENRITTNIWKKIIKLLK